MNFSETYKRINAPIAPSPVLIEKTLAKALRRVFPIRRLAAMAAAASVLLCTPALAARTEPGYRAAVQDSGGLLRAAALVIVEVDDGTVFGRQLCQRGVQAGFLRLIVGVDVLQGDGSPPPGRGSQAFGAVGRHPQEPGPAVLLAGKGRGGAVVAEEDLLKDVVGVMAAAELGVCQPVDHRAVLLYGGFCVHLLPPLVFMWFAGRSVINTLLR